jgi:hypothetical protein
LIRVERSAAVPELLSAAELKSVVLVDEGEPALKRRGNISLLAGFFRIFNGFAI